MLWAAGPGEGDVQCLCCNIRSPTPAEERACHRVVMEPHHSSVIFHHHIDVTEDKCTVREDPPDPTDFPAPFNSLEKCLKCVCVCVCVLVLLRSGRAFGGRHQQKAYRGWKLGCHREDVTWSPVMQRRPLELLPPLSELYQPPQPPVRKVVSPFQPFEMSLGHHRDGRCQLHQCRSAEKLLAKWILPGEGSLWPWMGAEVSRAYPRVVPPYLSCAPPG